MLRCYLQPVNSLPPLISPMFKLSPCHANSIFGKGPLTEPVGWLIVCVQVVIMWVGGCSNPLRHKPNISDIWVVGSCRTTFCFSFAQSHTNINWTGFQNNIFMYTWQYVFFICFKILPTGVSSCCKLTHLIYSSRVGTVRGFRYISVKHYRLDSYGSHIRRLLTENG